MRPPRDKEDNLEVASRRMSRGGDSDFSAPVDRLGRVGESVDPLSDNIPEHVSYGDGGPGTSDLLSREDHTHPSPPPSDVIPQPVVPGPGGFGDDDAWSRGDHQHPLDVDAIEWDGVFASDPHGNEAHSPVMTEASVFNAHTADGGAHGASVTPTADSIARRNPAAQVEVAPATAGTHAVALSQATVTSDADSLVRRNPTGQTEVADATSGVHVMNRQTADSRYVETSTGENPQVIANRVRTPAGDGTTPAVEVGSASYGLYQAGTSLGLAAGGSGRFLVRQEGIFPTVTGVSSLGSATSRFNDAYASGVIHTTAAPTTGPAIHAPNGAIEGSALVAVNQVEAQQSGWGVHSDGMASIGQGMNTYIKDGQSHVKDELGLENYRDVVAQGFIVSSARDRKSQIQPNLADDLSEIARTQTFRYRPRFKEDVLGPETVGLITDSAPADVVDILRELTRDEDMGEIVGTGVNLYPMVAKAWRALQQVEARLEALEK